MRLDGAILAATLDSFLLHLSHPDGRERYRYTCIPHTVYPETELVRGVPDRIPRILLERFANSCFQSNSAMCPDMVAWSQGLPRPTTIQATAVFNEIPASTCVISTNNIEITSIAHWDRYSLARRRLLHYQHAYPFLLKHPQYSTHSNENHSSITMQELRVRNLVIANERGR